MYKYETFAQQITTFMPWLLFSKIYIDIMHVLKGKILQIGGTLRINTDALPYRLAAFAL